MLAGVLDPIKEKITVQILMGRIADPAEIAGIHAFLASEEAGYIAGQVIFVRGDSRWGFDGAARGWLDVIRQSFSGGFAGHSKLGSSGSPSMPSKRWSKRTSVWQRY